MFFQGAMRHWAESIYKYERAQLGAGLTPNFSLSQRPEQQEIWTPKPISALRMHLAVRSRVDLFPKNPSLFPTNHRSTKLAGLGQACSSSNASSRRKPQPSSQPRQLDSATMTLVLRTPHILPVPAVFSLKRNLSPDSAEHSSFAVFRSFAFSHLDVFTFSQAIVFIKTEYNCNNNGPE